MSKNREERANYYLYIDGQAVPVSEQVYHVYQHYERKTAYVLDDIQERSKIIVLLIGAVHTAVHGDETDIMFGEKHFRVKTDFQIVSSDTAHILCNDNAYLVVLYQFDHAVPIGAVEVSTGVTIVHKKLDVSETLFFCVFLENRLLIDNAVALSCEFVITTQSTVDSSNFVRLPILSIYI